MIFVTGGTGFIGKALIQTLVALGKPVRILLRPSLDTPNLPMGVPVEVAVCSINDERGLRAALRDVNMVFHLAGTERRGTRADLDGVDVQGTRQLVEAASQAGVEKITLLSHLGADRMSAYPVFKAKGLAEGFIMRSGMQYTIFRSAVAYGPGDQFTIPLVKLLRASPGFFLMPGGGEVVLQPIWIEDLVSCLLTAIDDRATDQQVYSIGGSEYLNFREILQTIMHQIGIRRKLLPIAPTSLRNLALFIEQVLPRFPVSIFWIDYLAIDRTCALDSLPRNFGLMPARFTYQLDYLTGS